MRRAAEPQVDDQDRRARARTDVDPARRGAQTFEDAQSLPTEPLVLAPVDAGREVRAQDVDGETRECLLAHDAASYNLEVARETFRNVQFALGTAEAQLEEMETELQLRIEARNATQGRPTTGPG